MAKATAEAKAAVGSNEPEGSNEAPMAVKGSNEATKRSNKAGGYGVCFPPLTA